MKVHHRLPAAVAALAGAIAISCGEVPTLENGIAYLLPLELPAPAIVIGDTLRDDAGRVAPLRVRAIGRDGAEITDVPITFLPTALPARVSIDEAGRVVAHDTTGSVQVVARVGRSLQTTPVTLLVVPQPTAMVAASPVRDSVATGGLPKRDTVVVSVTGPYREGVTAVAGVIVRYDLTPHFRSDAVAGADLGTGTGTGATTAVDTTDTSGLASRVLTVFGTGVDSVVVRAAARDFRGRPLPTVRFVLRVFP